ncbi:MAG: hypothetical protein AAF766_24295 [Cyanobacteria bacterium P01_D01_bin.14]
MPPALLIVLTAVVTAVAGYLMNQLPAIRQFPGSGWLLTRLLIWVTLVPWKNRFPAPSINIPL